MIFCFLNVLKRIILSIFMLIYTKTEENILRVRAFEYKKEIGDFLLVYKGFTHGFTQRLSIWKYNK